MVDTKNGESYDGLLTGCDNYMNLKLNEVTITTSDGKFYKSNEVFIRGNNIKSIQFDDSVLIKHQTEIKKKCKSFYFPKKIRIKRKFPFNILS